MLKKRHVHYAAKKLRPISKWYFLIAAIFFTVTAVYGLRQNNLKAIQLRDEVIAADKANKDVETKLRNLREFIYSHMNADLSAGSNTQQPIQLKYRYERLVNAEKKRVDKLSGSIYTEAQKSCEKKFPLGAAGASGGGRVACIEDFVTKSGVTPINIPEDLYKFDFISPFWSPDLAGLSIVLAIIAGLLFVFRIISDKWLIHELHKNE